MTFKDSVVMVAAFLLAVANANAAGFTTLHSFSATSGSNSTNTDGANPQCDLVLSGNTLYGTTFHGGTNGSGTVFKVNTDGTGFTILHHFATTALDASSNPTNSDGELPLAGLTLSGSTLYGTTKFGGIYGSGTIFALNTNGTGFTNLYNFTEIYPIYDENNNNDGAYPQCALTLSGNTLYGTTFTGGVDSGGAAFAINTNGANFTDLNYFDLDSGPIGKLVLSANTLFGVTYGQGGDDPTGTVFAVNTNGANFTNLFVFSYTNGFELSAGLILSGNTLYGTASGGSTIFAINSNGSGFTVLHQFAAGTTNSSGVFIYPDGFCPLSDLVLSGNTLYGTTQQGGGAGSFTNYYGQFNRFSTVGYGTVFAVNTDGSGFKVLYNFAGGTNGANPAAGMILSGNTLYGTTAAVSANGSNGYGTVFSLTLPPPQLTITPSGAKIILTWPTNVLGFTLQSATNLVSPVWNTVSPAPSVVGGQDVVTNAISGTQKFFRLQSN